MARRNWNKYAEPSADMLRKIWREEYRLEKRRHAKKESPDLQDDESISREDESGEEDDIYQSGTGSDRTNVSLSKEKMDQIVAKVQSAYESLNVLRAMLESLEKNEPVTLIVFPGDEQDHKGSREQFTSKEQTSGSKEEKEADVVDSSSQQGEMSIMNQWKGNLTKLDSFEKERVEELISDIRRNALMHGSSISRILCGPCYRHEFRLCMEYTNYLFSKILHVSFLIKGQRDSIISDYTNTAAEFASETISYLANHEHKYSFEAAARPIESFVRNLMSFVYGNQETVQKIMSKPFNSNSFFAFIHVFRNFVEFLWIGLKIDEETKEEMKTKFIKMFKDFYVKHSKTPWASVGDT